MGRVSKRQFAIVAAGVLAASSACRADLVSGYYQGAKDENIAFEAENYMRISVPDPLVVDAARWAIQNAPTSGIEFWGPVGGRFVQSWGTVVPDAFGQVNYVGPGLSYDFRVGRTSSTWDLWVRAGGTSKSNDTVDFKLFRMDAGVETEMWAASNVSIGFNAAFDMDRLFNNMTLVEGTDYRATIYMRQPGSAVDRVILSTDAGAPAGLGPDAAPLVPEPGTACVLGVVATGLLARRRRRVREIERKKKHGR